MKRCATPSGLRRSTALLPLASAALLPLASAALLPLALASATLLPLAACVSRGAYHEVEAERDALALEKQQLEERITLLEASTESLGVERVALIDEMETLREAHAELDRDVKSLSAAKSELSENLAAREAELAARQQEVSQLRGTYEGLVADLESEVATGQIEIQQLREGLQLNLTQDVLFASGSAELNDAGRAVLRKVAQRLNEVPHRIEVRGHTDSIPIRGALAAKFPSNWELAGARASGVVRFLAERKVDPRRLVSVSHGEYEPIASNDTPEGRQKNRRIAITLEPSRPEPATAAAAPKPTGAPPPAPAGKPAGAPPPAPAANPTPPETPAAP